MGNFFSSEEERYVREPPAIVYYDDEVEECIEAAENVNIDAIYANVPQALRFNFYQFTFKDVMEIERTLDFYEKVSMVYLLYEDSHVALQELILAERSEMRNSLLNWASVQERSEWSLKFQEALCIIQNYEILIKYGFNKADLIDHFLPNSPTTSLRIKAVKKELYNIFDNLTAAQTNEILSIIQKDFGPKFKLFNYIEMHLLHWENEKYITEINLNKLKVAFKSAGLIEISDRLTKYSAFVDEVNKGNNEEVEEAKSENRKTFDNVTDGDHNNCVSSPFVNQNKNEAYFIDPNCPGYILIINQMHFYEELSHDYDHLKLNSCEKLEDRLGSEKDAEELQKLFKSIGFEVQIEEDLEHMEIEKKVIQFLDKIQQHSSVFIFILSHGEEGTIFGSNSCLVQVQDIVELMATRNRKYLQGKPKVLILQSCQGREAQPIIDNGMEVTLDGPAKQVAPTAADMLIFWSIIPGFASFRREKTGSWFIQTLCQEIRELASIKHFSDICTNTLRKVTSKKGIHKNTECMMTPYKTDTFTKLLFLPQINSETKNASL